MRTDTKHYVRITYNRGAAIFAYCGDSWLKSDEPYRRAYASLALAGVTCDDCRSVYIADELIHEITYDAETVRLVRASAERHANDPKPASSGRPKRKAPTCNHFWDQLVVNSLREEDRDYMNGWYCVREPMHRMAEDGTITYVGKDK